MISENMTLLTTLILVLIAVSAVVLIGFGGYFGSKIALRISPISDRLYFGIIMVIISMKLLYSGYQGLSNEK